MKAVTEFASFTLAKGLAAKTALTTEGKTPEEIQASLGATFKLEGEKLTCFMNALDIAAQRSGNLKRVIVIRLGEGETNAPAGATKVEELYYVPEILNLTAAKPPEKPEKGGKRGRGGPQRGGQKGGPKESPWGLSPEEKAAKNKKATGTPT